MADPRERHADRADRAGGQEDPASTDLDAAVEAYFRELRQTGSADLEAIARRVAGREQEFKELVETLRVLEAAATSQPPSGGDAPGRERIGRFRLVRQLGRGGMGVVHEAVDETLDRPVALKLLPGHATLEEREVARFQREAHAAARLSHPHIVSIYGVGFDEGVHWIAMQLIRGESVEQLLRRAREHGVHPLPIADVVRHSIAVADALAAAHREGILHRDVKPSNLLIDEHGEIWVTDFGLAKSTDSATLTRTGEAVGTPRYMAPEAFAGWADPRTDVWGLGATLYEMLAGRPAFDGGDRAQLLKQISDVEPPPLRRVDPAIPRDLATVATRCLQKEPNARYATARALADDLRSFAAGEPIRARPPSLAYRMGLVARRHPTATTLLVIALTGGIVATALEATRARGAEGRERERFDDVRKLAESFLFEFHDAIQSLPGATKARELVVKRALEYLDRLAKESSDDASLRRELATAYQKVGDVQGNPFQSNLGDLAGARRSYATAIGLIEPLVAAGTASDDDRSVLAAAELGCGGIALAQGDSSAAISMSGKGLELRRRLAEAKPDMTRKQELATAYQYHAFNLSGAERVDDAIAALAQQASLLDELLAATPADVTLRRHSGHNRYLVAHALMRQGKDQDARAAYESAISIQRRLLDEDAGNTLLRSDLGWSYNDFGAFLATTEDRAAALQCFEESLRIHEALAAADPKSVDARAAVAMAHENVGDTLLDVDRVDEAIVHVNEALSRFEALVKDDPSNGFNRKLLASCYALRGRAAASCADPASLAAARDDYRRAVDMLQELRAAGRLIGTHASSLEDAQKGLAECEARLAAESAKEPPRH
jgi:eukaryotic-like serine/threonine-protein kinase